MFLVAQGLNGGRTHRHELRVYGQGPGIHEEIIDSSFSLCGKMVRHIVSNLSCNRDDLFQLFS